MTGGVHDDVGGGLDGLDRVVVQEDVHVDVDPPRFRDRVFEPVRQPPRDAPTDRPGPRPQHKRPVYELDARR